MKKRILNSAIVLAMGIIAVSCGEARDPLGSVPDTHSGPILTQIPNPEGTEFIVFGGAAFARTKSVSSATSQVEIEEKIVDGSKKAALKVSFQKYDSPIQVRTAEFKIEKNSIGGVEPLQGNRYLVIMTVETGQSMADIKVAFSPSGMTFDPVAKLKLKVKGDLDPENLVAYHVSKDGNVTQPKLKVTKEKSSWKLEIEVPGFSEYSVDDDEMNQEDEY